MIINYLIIIIIIYLQECKVCGKYVTKMKRHMQEVHSDKRYECEICLKTFTRVEKLKIHMKKEHFDD